MAVVPWGRGCFFKVDIIISLEASQVSWGRRGTQEEAEEGWGKGLGEVEQEE